MSRSWNVGWFLATCLWVSPAQGLERSAARTKAPAPLPGDAACLRLLPEDSPLSRLLGELQAQVKGTPYAVNDVRFVGLQSLDEHKVWALLGGRPAGPLSWEQSAAVVARLSESGLFVRVTPRLDPKGGVLEVEVVEHPTVHKVELRGAEEVDRAAVLSALFVAPSQRAYEESREPRRPVRWHDDDEDDEDEDGEDGDYDRDGDRRVRARWDDAELCPPPVPSPEWVARADEERFDGGIAWKGLGSGLKRLRQELLDDGYLLATVRAQLAADGTLTVDVEEGRLGRLELVGLLPPLSGRVESMMALRPGQILLRSDVEAALERVRKALPFVSPRRGAGGFEETPALKEEALPDGGVRFTFAERPSRVSVRWTGRWQGHLHRHDDEDDDWTDHVPRMVRDWEPDSDERGDFIEASGDVVRVHLKVITTSASADPAELLRHTQATSFAPGLWSTLRYQDPADRFRLAADLGVNVNVAREGRGRFDLLVGPRVALPTLKLGEVGAQYHALVDTTDRWRLVPIDSYLQSVILNRPSADYFRRTGLTAFLSTERLFGFVLGVEYRLDEYATLPPLEKVFTVFRRDEPPFPNPAIDDGPMESVLFRLEWTNRVRSAYDLRAARRDPELPLYEPTFDDRFTVRTNNTLEVAGPLLAGSAFHFIRIVSDSAAYLPVGRDHGVWLRFRGAGGNGLPLQKQEALGGWGSLRGYEFKEFRGDFSLLGSAEYRFWEVFSVFLDVGTVRAEGRWMTPRLDFGTAFNIGEEFHVAAAWRTDEFARPAPQVMAFFRRPF